MPVPRQGSEIAKIEEFLLLLLRESSSGRIKMTYRGDKIENLFERLNIFFNPRLPDYEQMIERLFMVGEKSKHFYVDTLTSVPGRQFKLDDVGEASFAYIFDQLTEVTKSKRAHHVEFFRKNDSFRNYFKDKGNKPFFLSDIEIMDDRKKLIIKRYYLTLLHQLAYVNYKKKSILISTSEEKNIAKQFASHSRQKPGFRLHVWTPTAISLVKYFKGSGLPMYKHVPFKIQEEVSFFAGILPHYIVALEVMGKRKIFYNPAILTNNITPFTLLNGLDIDQSNFENVIR
ncbi:MAG TPA: hypothetical protein VGM41_10670 [Chitinophagaceae bacterium]|jgi:hypothetical protein